jgi:hypothetical protein
MIPEFETLDNLETDRPDITIASPDSLQARSGAFLRGEGW